MVDDRDDLCAGLAVDGPPPVETRNGAASGGIPEIGAFFCCFSKGSFESGSFWGLTPGNGFSGSNLINFDGVTSIFQIN